MGSGASVTLKEKMSEAYLRECAGEDFDEVKYNALHDENGDVSKDLLLSTVLDGIAREVYITYISYCPNGLMLLDQYVMLLRNSKFLDKKNNRQSAEILFHAARFAVEDSDMRVNYYTFVKKILPKLAEQRGTQTDQLFDKLAFVELGKGLEKIPDISDSKPVSLMESLSMAAAAVASNSGKITAVATVATPPPPSEQEKDKAATLMQKKARARNAKRKVNEMREIKTIRGEKKIAPPRYPRIDLPPQDLASVFKKPSPIIRQFTTGDLNAKDNLDALGAEVILEDVFEEYCVVPGEIDSANLKKMFREQELLTRKFTTVDMDIVFRKGVAKVLASEIDNPLREGVIFEKRVTFPVFRAEMIGAAAKAKGVTLDQLLETLKTNYIERHRKKCSERDHGLSPDNAV